MYGTYTYGKFIREIDRENVLFINDKLSWGNKLQ